MSSRSRKIQAGLIVAFLLLGAAAPAPAGSLQRGLAAFAHHDYVKAAYLLQPLAARGDANAQMAMCFMYTHGRGVPQNYYAAAAWCKRAANQGNPAAQYQLGLLYDKGHGVPADVILAYKWLNLAAASAMGPKRDFSYKLRDAVASKMSRSEIAVGQRLALEWRPKPERLDAGPAN
jgi:uncharacterized protein